jgi:hypothetical protein
MLVVVASLLDFDDSRSSLATFIDRVAESKTRSVLRKTAAKKRNQKYASRMPREPLKVILSIELGWDLERALKKLGKKDRDVARLLVEHKPAEAARPSQTLAFGSLSQHRSTSGSLHESRFLTLFRLHRTLRGRIAYIVFERSVRRKAPQEHSTDASACRKVGRT